VTTADVTAVAVSVRPHPRVRNDSVAGHDAYESMPTEGPLVDRYGRVHTDLRISVTDRCNLRCVYCMDEDMTFLPRSALLTYEEIERLSRVAFGLGITALRLTGGEPLVRKDLVQLVSKLSAVGYEDLALTTNGMLLAPIVRSLADAGLRRVNVSCDSLRPDRFNAIRRRGDLSRVLKAMDAVEAAGLLPLKVNVVILRGRNDDEILDFARFARDTGRVVRFIEFMPLDASGQWDRDQLVSGREIFERINDVWSLTPLENGGSARPSGSRSPTAAVRSDSSRRSHNRSVGRATACDSRATARSATACSRTTSTRCATSFEVAAATTTRLSCSARPCGRSSPGTRSTSPTSCSRRVQCR